MRVAVIGAGPSGLPALKSCLEEGLEVVCFEYRDKVGGLWNYSNGKLQDGLASVMQITTCNQTKELMSYSDFLAPRDFPQFMPHEKALKYLQMYAEHFRLVDHIRFNTEVIHVSQITDLHQKNVGKWEVMAKNLTTNVIDTEIVDAVLVCTGHDGTKYIPKFKGQKDFQGQVLHSHEYRTKEPFKNKRVVIVGCGNSALDIAVDLSNVCNQVWLSSRRGTWILSRLGIRGLPFEVSLHTRLSNAMQKGLPKCVSAKLARAELNSHFDHAYYGLEPDYEVGAQIPSINDIAPSVIASGAVIVKPSIEKMTSHGVVFVDGSIVENVDAIIYATGSSMKYPFIDHEAFQVKAHNDLLLYRKVFVPDIQPPTLALIGCVDPNGPVQSAAEMQARYAARVFKGAINLPDADEMRRREEDYRDMQRRTFAPSGRQLLMVILEDYMDLLAKEIGCMPPSFLRLWLTDRPLCWAVYTSMFTSHQYRLVGPGAWPGARQAVLEVMDRLQYPVNAAAVDNRKRMDKAKKSGHLKLFVACIVVLVVAVAFPLFTGGAGR